MSTTRNDASPGLLLLRPLCWFSGHRWGSRLTLAGPLMRCMRCGKTGALKRV